MKQPKQQQEERAESEAQHEQCEESEHHAIVAEHAYHLWEKEGYVHGRHLDHWLAAERGVQESRSFADAVVMPSSPARGKDED